MAEGGRRQDGAAADRSRMYDILRGKGAAWVVLFGGAGIVGLLVRRGHSALCCGLVIN
jgi:hypothetical protein